MARGIRVRAVLLPDTVEGIRRGVEEARIPLVRVAERSFAYMRGVNARAYGLTDRDYVDLVTGEVFSRRQFDETYGRLAGTTIERAAKKSPLRKLRPARGRKSKLWKLKEPTVKHASGIDFSRISRGKLRGYYRGYTIPATLYSLSDALLNAKKNKRIFGLGIPNLVLENGSFSQQILPMTYIDDIPSPLDLWDKILDAMGDNGIVSGLLVVAIIIGVIFRNP